MSNVNLQPPAEEPQPEAISWAEMLARIGEKHARLTQATEALRPRDPVKQTPFKATARLSSVLEEIEKERGRIARELHAGVGQPLAGIRINLEFLDSWSKTMPEEVRQALARLNSLADAALGQVRAVSHRLHPPDWQNLSVTEALEKLVNGSGLTRKCVTRLDLDPLPIEPSHALKIVLYRCAQECISNVLRHSGATEFALALKATEGMLQMTVRDNGQGIPDQAHRGGGIGLASIREHAWSVEGTARIVTSPEGTTIEISLPLTED